MVLIDHLNELTVEMVLDAGCWMGFSIYPDTKIDGQRMVAILREHGITRVLVNSAADWEHSDPLATYRTGCAMLTAGFSESDVEQVLWGNPVDFYEQSGRLMLDPLEQTQTMDEAFAGNSVLRGARADRAAS